MRKIIKPYLINYTNWWHTFSKSNSYVCDVVVACVLTEKISFMQPISVFNRKKQVSLLRGRNGLWDQLWHYIIKCIISAWRINWINIIRLVELLRNWIFLLAKHIAELDSCSFISSILMKSVEITLIFSVLVMSKLDNPCNVS